MRTYKILFINQTGTSWDLSENTRYWKEHVPVNQRLNCEVTEVKGNYILRHKLTRLSNGDNRLTLLGIDEAIAKDYSGYDTYIFAYNEKDAGHLYNIVKKNKDWYFASVTPFKRLHNKAYCEIAVEDDWGNDRFVRTFNHELHHCIERLFYSVGIYINDVMDKTLVAGNWKSYWRNRDMFGKDTNRTRTMEVFAPHWDKLPLVSDNIVKKAVQILTKETVGYKYFSAFEAQGMKPEIMEKLDATRGDSGFPFVKNSGLRDSGSHASGYEMDVDINGADFYQFIKNIYSKGKGQMLYDMVKYGHDFFDKYFAEDKQWIVTKNAMKNGITRIGVYNGHMHLGIDPASPQFVIWSGVSE